jgi:hypothetical protein
VFHMTPLERWILESKSITDKTKEDLRSGKVSVNEAYEMVVLDQECQSLYQKCLKAVDESKKSDAEIDNQPERTKKETERLRAMGEGKLRAEIIKPFRNSFEKGIECVKAYAAFCFSHDIESVAIETLREIDEDEIQRLPCQKIEQILHHALIENKVDVNKIRYSKAIQAKLELLRQEQEVGDKD